MKTCGCGNKLKSNETYEVYSPPQLHCESCMKEAIESSIPVPVRKVDLWEVMRNDNRTAS